MLEDEDPEANPEIGNGVRVICEGVTYFVGYVFKCSYTPASKEFKVTAYDQLRYLKASDTLVTKQGQTASQIVKTVCGLIPNIRLGTIEDTGHPLGVMTFDGKSMLDMIAESVTSTLIAAKKLFYLKDEGGLVVFRDIANSITGLVIAPDSLLYDYSYERSIDDDTYNQIKLVRDNEATGQREVYMAKDSGSIGRWGTLQYYEKVDDGLNPEKIKEKADSLLFLKNRVTQKLSADVIGEKEIRAGNMIYVELPDAGVNKFLLCLSAKHRFTNAAHTVKAEFKLV